jgi:uncharacterized protein
MKSTLFLLCFGLSILLSAAPAKAQKADAAPGYDAELAKRLGADDMGMRQYVMCFLKTGPLKVDDAAKRAELMKGHFGMINRLADEGKLIVAGPFSNGGEFRGIYLFDVKTIEEAQKLTETDPSIKEGYFKVEFIKWYGSAALMEVNNIHKKIAKKNP